MRWQGPVHAERARFEERRENVGAALAAVKFGLEACPRYGPLWFAAFRLKEKEWLHHVNSCAPQHVKSPSASPSPFDCIEAKASSADEALQQLRVLFDVGRQHISKELVWKVYFEAAQMEERVGCLDHARLRLYDAVDHCPANLLWKIWLGGIPTFPSC